MLGWALILMDFWLLQGVRCFWAFRRSWGTRFGEGEVRVGAMAWGGGMYTRDYRGLPAAGAATNLASGAESINSLSRFCCLEQQVESETWWRGEHHGMVRNGVSMPALPACIGMHGRVSP